MGTIFYKFKLPKVQINYPKCKLICTSGNLDNLALEKQSKCIFDSDRCFEFHRIRDIRVRDIEIRLYHLCNQYHGSLKIQGLIRDPNCLTLRLSYRQCFVKRFLKDCLASIHLFSGSTLEPISLSKIVPNFKHSINIFKPLRPKWIHNSGLFLIGKGSNSVNPWKRMALGFVVKSVMF